MKSMFGRISALSKSAHYATVTRTSSFHVDHALCLQRLPQTPEDVEKMPIFEYASKNQKGHRRLYMWGCSETGALGKPNLARPKRRSHRPNKPFMHCPTRVAFGHDHKVDHVGCGYGFTVVAVDSDDKHKVFGTGINCDSQIGFHQVRRGHPLECLINFVPIAIPFKNPSSTVVTHVACGRAHTIIATDKEGVFSLGNNAYGQCGRPIVENEKYSGNPIIRKVKGLDENCVISKIVCGHDHTLILTDKGEVLACGMGCDGQLGREVSDSSWELSRVLGDVVGEKIVDISSKGDFVLAISEKGELFGWGNNEYNQLGNKAENTQLSYSKHLGLQQVGKVVKVAAAGTMCAGLNDKGEVYAWGYGILGFGPEVQLQIEPRIIPPVLFGRNQLNTDVHVKDISCGLTYFAAITNKGDLYMWGMNKKGCLGLGDREENRFFPVQVCVPAEVKKVHAGVDHTAAECLSYI